MKILECAQGSPEWLDAHLGLASASRFDEIITAVNMKPSAAMKTYAAELIAEWFTGQRDPWKWEGETADMRRGSATENQARHFVRIVTGADIRQVGFIIHDDGRWGCSPDGLIGTDSGLELKCPAPKTQVKWLADGVLPPEHKAQVHGGLVVTGLPCWEFVSYCIGLPPLRVHVEPDEFTWKLQQCLVEFNEVYDALMAKIRSRLDQHVLDEIDRRRLETPIGLRSFINDVA